MMHTEKVFYDNGFITIDKQAVWWKYNHRVDIVIHEKTETFSAKLIGGDRMCLHDLKTKLRTKFRAAAQAEARRKYAAELDAKREANTVHVDVTPKDAVDAFR